MSNKESDIINPNPNDGNLLGQDISDLEFWQQRTPKKLTEEDVREINENLTGFFDTLARWDREDKDKAND